jgi:hypothetical protein
MHFARAWLFRGLATAVECAHPRLKGGPERIFLTDLNLGFGSHCAMQFRRRVSQIARALACEPAAVGFKPSGWMYSS